MRHLLISIFAFLLACSPASVDLTSYAQCPPLTPEQAMRVQPVERNAGVGVAVNSPTRAIAITGFDDLCRDDPEQFICVGDKSDSKVDFETVKNIDYTLKVSFEYRMDDVMYGRDRWSNSEFCGDCEDFVLAAAQKLHEAGAGGKTMWLELMSTAPGTAHAMLLVETSDAGLQELTVWRDYGVIPYDGERWDRFGLIPFDGTRRVIPYPGYRVTRSTIERQ